VFLVDDPAGRRPEIRGRFDMGSACVSGRFVIRNATIQVPADVSEVSTYARSAAIGTAFSAARLSVGAEVMLAGRCEVTGEHPATQVLDHDVLDGAVAAYLIVMKRCGRAPSLSARCRQDLREPPLA
jgi:hypothetical protein